MEEFSIRPGYQSEQLLVEFWGDHRSDDYPRVSRILATRLSAVSVQHPTFDTATLDNLAIACDEFISYWTYPGGAYEIHDDVYSLFVLAPNNNAGVMMDLERTLLASGRFKKREVDFSTYR